MPDSSFSSKPFNLPTPFKSREEQVLYLLLRAADESSSKERLSSGQKKIVKLLKEISTFLKEKGFSSQEKGEFYTSLHSILVAPLLTKRHYSHLSYDRTMLLKAVAVILKNLTLEAKRKFLDALFILSILSKMYGIEVVGYVFSRASKEKGSLWKILTTDVLGEELALDLLRVTRKTKEVLANRKELSPSQKEALFVDTLFYFLYDPQKYRLAQILLNSSLSDRNLFKAFIFLRSLSRFETERVLLDKKTPDIQRIFKLLQTGYERKLSDIAQALERVKRVEEAYERNQPTGANISVLVSYFKEFLKWTLGESFQKQDSSRAGLITGYEELLFLIQRALEKGTAPLINPDIFLERILEFVQISSLAESAILMWEKVLKQPKAMVILNERTAAPLSGVLGFSERFIKENKIAREHLLSPLLFHYLSFLREAESRRMGEQEIREWRRKLGWEGCRIVPLQYIRIPSGEPLSEEKREKVRNLFFNLSKVLGKDTLLVFVDMSKERNPTATIYAQDIAFSLNLSQEKRWMAINPWWEYCAREKKPPSIPPIDDFYPVRGIVEELELYGILEERGESVVLHPLLPRKLFLPHPWLLEYSLSGLIEENIGKAVEKYFEAKS